MKMTKMTIALAMLGLSAAAFAGAPGNQVVAPSGVNLIAPDSVGVWSIGLEAMVVQPTNNEFTYAKSETNRFGLINNDFTFNHRAKGQVVDPKWQWGGTVDLTYMFPGSSRDVKLAWTHLFDQTSTNTTRIGEGQNIFGGDRAIVPVGGVVLPLLIPGAFAKGSEDTEYNAVDLVFGQWIKIGDRLDLHPFGGLRWAQVDSTFKARYDYNTEALLDDWTTTAAAKLTSNFNGIGPRAGFDTAVHLGSGFSIVGTFAGSLLIGDISSSNKGAFNTNFPGLVIPGVITIPAFSIDAASKNNFSHNNTRVVPELDARLGLDYMYAFTPATSMNVQLGYQVVNYFNVTQADLYSTATVPLVSGPNTTSNREDWGYQGPYLRLQLNLA